MKRVLFDTNIFLDVFLEREPFVEASSDVWTAIEQGTAEGAASAHAVITLHYLIRKQHGNGKAKIAIGKLIQIFEVAAVTRSVIDDALSYNCPDFEDAVTAAAAHAAGCEFIITRDPKGFRGTPMTCLTPEAAVALLSLPQ